MGTVSKEIADKIVAGNGVYPGDPRCARIVEYTNAWGGTAYGVEMPHELGRYRPSAYVINPRTYWEAD